MDLHAERQMVASMKSGDSRKFLLLFDANFAELYKYVARRVEEPEEIERVVRLTFLDAIGQIANTPTDISYLVWLYSLAKPRIWAYLSAKSTQPPVKDSEGDKVEILAEAKKMFAKLSLEEREILKLKFFEHVADGDVMAVLGQEDGQIGTKVYRVIKRAHFLLFGNREGGQAVYFPEINAFMEKAGEEMKLKVPEVLKLSLKAEFSNKIDRQDFALEVEEAETTPAGLEEVEEAKVVENKPTGSNDPAKIFVEAVKEMREEEAQAAEREQLKMEKRERILSFFDKWKYVLPIAPAALFVAVGFFVVLNFISFNVERGYPTTCEIEVAFEGEFSDSEMRSVNAGVSDRLCDHFQVNSMMISRSESGHVEVELDVPDWFLQYEFVKKIKDWRIQKYARTLTSSGDGESRKVSRDKGNS